jgi:uncharacterized protein YegL
LPTFKATGSTAMFEAIVKAGDLMLECLRGYNARDVDAYCGNIFNITDGAPNPSEAAEERARKVVGLFSTAGSHGNPYAQFFHVGVPGYRRDALARVSSSDESIIDMSDGDISKFFEFIRASMNPSKLQMLG